MTNICAVDVGYGNVKYAVKEGAELRCHHFRSVVGLAPEGPSLSDGVGIKKNVVVVEVGGVKYVVGPDADLAGRGTQRILNREYSESGHYMALLRGALRYIGMHDIDLLVTGLPVEYYQAYRASLAERIQGVHRYPDGSQVRVRESWILPQPIGGFVSCTAGRGVYHEIRDKQVLVCDAGYYTYDWLTTTGMRISETRIGSTAGGVSTILSVLAEKVSADMGEPFDHYEKLDEGISSDWTMRWNGEIYDFARFRGAIEPLIEKTCHAMLNNVGTLGDIDSIVLVGGGARHYVDALKRICRRRDILVDQDALFANVQGFHLAGEKRARHHG